MPAFRISLSGRWAEPGTGSILGSSTGRVHPPAFHRGGSAPGFPRIVRWPQPELGRPSIQKGSSGPLSIRGIWRIGSWRDLGARTRGSQELIWRGSSGRRRRKCSPHEALAELGRRLDPFELVIFGKGAGNRLRLRTYFSRPEARQATIPQTKWSMAK